MPAARTSETLGLGLVTYISLVASVTYRASQRCGEVSSRKAAKHAVEVEIDATFTGDRYMYCFDFVPFYFLFIFLFDLDNYPSKNEKKKKKGGGSQ